MTCPPDCLVCYLTRGTRTPAFREALHERQASRPNATDRELIAYGTGWLVGRAAGISEGLALNRQRMTDDR